MDTFLLKLVEEVGAGKPVPSLHVVTSSGDWVRGAPCSDHEFRELAWGTWLDEVRNEIDDRPRRPRNLNPLDNSEVAEAASEAFHAFGSHLELGEQGLNLKDAFLSFGGRGDGLKLPVIRVPLSSVSSWWIGGPEYVKPKTGTAVAAGVLIPINT